MMRSLAVGKYTSPSGYEVLDLPTPSIQNPDDVLIQVYASTILTGDTVYASGKGRLIFPIKYV